MKNFIGCSWDGIQFGPCKMTRFQLIKEVKIQSISDELCVVVVVIHDLRLVINMENPTKEK